MSIDIYRYVVLVRLLEPASDDPDLVGRRITRVARQSRHEHMRDPPERSTSKAVGAAIVKGTLFMVPVASGPSPSSGKPRLVLRTRSGACNGS